MSGQKLKRQRAEVEAIERRTVCILASFTCTAHMGMQKKMLRLTLLYSLKIWQCLHKLFIYLPYYFLDYTLGHLFTYRVCGPSVNMRAAFTRGWHLLTHYIACAYAVGWVNIALA